MDLVPIETLTRAPQTRQGFDLALPNPILGKTIFVRLQPEGDWRYAADPADLRAERNLILRDCMWVTRGQARFVAVYASGARVEVKLKIKPMKARARRPGVSFNFPGSEQDESNPHDPADKRMAPTGFLARLRERLHESRERRLIIYCGHTDRRIRVTARNVSGGLSSDLFAHFLGALQCH